MYHFPACAESNMTARAVLTRDDDPSRATSALPRTQYRHHADAGTTYACTGSLVRYVVGAA